MIDLPEDFPVNCFLCPLDPAGAAAEIRERFTVARLDELSRALKPTPPPVPEGAFGLRPVEGLTRVKIVREGRSDSVELYLRDREAATTNVRFLGERIACLLRSRYESAAAAAKAGG